MELEAAAVLTAAPDGLLVVDRGGLFRYANPAAATMLGLSAPDVVGRSCRSWEVAAVDGSELAVDALPVLEVLRTGESAGEVEHALRRPDGAWAVVAHRAAPLRDANGAVEGAVVSLVDVTERTRAAEQLQRAESSFRMFLEQAREGITLQRDRHIFYANPAILEMLGYAPHEIVGRPLLDFIHPDDRPIVRERMRATIEEGRFVPPQAQRLVRRNGEPVEVETTALPIAVERVPTVVAISVDVTERNRTRRELERSRSTLTAALEATADGILVVDRKRRITAFNDRFVEMWRIPRALVEGRDEGRVTKYVLDQLKAPDVVVASTREVYASPERESEELLELADGRIYERCSRPQQIAGEAVGRVWSFRDVTARRRAEAERERLLAEVSRERELLKTVFDHVPVGITLHRGPDLVYELINPALMAMFGDEPRLGRPFAAVAPGTAPERRSILERVLATGVPYRAVDEPLRVRRTLEGPFEDAYFTIAYVRVPSPKGAAVVALYVDSTDRVRARLRIEELAAVSRRQTAELESIHANMLDGLLVCDADSRITHVNEAHTRMTGFPNLSVVGRTVGEYARTTGLRELDGGPLHERGLPLLRALSGEIVKDALFRYSRAGRTVCVRANATPIRNETGAIVGAVAVSRDVSDLVEFDRMKDQFIRVAAHELKTPVAIMKGYADLLLRGREQLPAASRDALEAIARGAVRIDDIVKELLDLSLLHLGQMELRRERVDLSALVAIVTGRMALTTHRHRIRVVESEPVVVQADRVRIEQVLGKLLDNAVRYSPRGGDVEVRLVVRDGVAVVSVRDHGIGIPTEKQTRVFQRFYRPHTDTPYDYGGMGVGLYISREIVARHGGAMWFESTEGEGSTFCFRLPIQPG
ncbi:MAG: hypothetical protein BGO98_15845 [Myxococcales bacterium 68-20]|nr:MAG: hypothetical protein BGO98_15845 [Myxococcales bacterium 68-20]